MAAVGWNRCTLTVPPAARRVSRRPESRHGHPLPDGRSFAAVVFGGTRAGAEVAA